MFRKMSTTITTTTLNVSCVKPFQDIPGPKSYPVIGSLWNYLPGIGKYDPTKLHVSGLQKYEEFGDLVREEVLPGKNYLFIYNPVDIESMFRNEGKYPSRRSHTAMEKIRRDKPGYPPSVGLLPTSAEEWHKFRVQFQKAMALENIQEYAFKTDEIIMDFMEKVDKLDSTIDLLPHILRLSLEVVGQSFVGMRVGNPKFDQSVDADEIIEKAEHINLTTVKTDQGLQLWRSIETPLYKQIKENLTFLENTAKMLLNSYQDKLEKKPTCILKAWLGQKNVNETDLVTMSADMLLAGIDTTSYSTSFMLYHIATNPECQERLHQELKTVLPKPNSPISPEMFANTPYLRWCIKESLRLNPISIGTGRTLQNDAIIGGYHVPAETYCVSMNQISCRLPKYFDRPNDFIPERWSPQNRKLSKVHPYLVIPFGHGPRACIGRRLAEQQMLMFIARMVRMFHLEWTGAKELGCLSVAINKPESPIQIRFKRADE